MNQYERQPEETRVDDLERDIESTRERMSRDLDALGEKLSPSRLAEEAASGMRRRARMRGRQLGDFVRENSLAVVAGAAVLGLAVGLAIPETRREEELMGPMRDRLAERAEAALERAEEAAGEVAETVRSEAAEQGRQAKGGVREAAEHVGRKVKGSAQEVVREATRPGP